jgi:hypothetical protein
VVSFLIPTSYNPEEIVYLLPGRKKRFLDVVHSFFHSLFIPIDPV